MKNLSLFDNFKNAVCAFSKDNELVFKNKQFSSLFGDIKSYLLPRSKIYISIPFKVFFEGKEEGKGFLPDYWIDSKNPTKYLEKWLKHNHLI